MPVVLVCIISGNSLFVSKSANCPSTLVKVICGNSSANGSTKKSLNSSSVNPALVIIVNSMGSFSSSTLNGSSFESTDESDSFEQAVITKKLIATTNNKHLFV